MAIQSGQSWVPLLTKGHLRELNEIIVSYMGRKDIDKMSCGDSQEAVIFKIFAKQFADEDTACRELGFQECIVRTFADEGLSLFRIPCLLLNEQSNKCCLNVKDMNGTSVGRFEIEKGRPALAFHVYLGEADTARPVVLTFYRVHAEADRWTSRVSDHSDQDGWPWKETDTENFCTRLKKVLTGLPVLRLVSQIYH